MFNIPSIFLHKIFFVCAIFPINFHWIWYSHKYLLCTPQKPTLNDFKLHIHTFTYIYLHLLTNSLLNLENLENLTMINIDIFFVLLKFCPLYTRIFRFSKIVLNSVLLWIKQQKINFTNIYFLSYVHKNLKSFSNFLIF